jgi:hypothetical protein
MPLTTEDRQTLEDLAQSASAWSPSYGLRRFLSLVELAFQAGALDPAAAQHLEMSTAPRRVLAVCLNRRLSGDPRFDFAYLGNRPALIRFLQLPLPMPPFGADADTDSLEETVRREPDVPAGNGTHALLLRNHKRMEFFAAFADLLAPLNGRLAQSFCQFHEPDLSTELATAYESLGYLAAAIGRADDRRLAEMRRALDVVLATLKSQSLARLLLSAALSGGSKVAPEGDKENLENLYSAVRDQVRGESAIEEGNPLEMSAYADTPERAQFSESYTRKIELEE